MSDRIWTGAVAVRHRGGFTAFGGWLRTPSGLLVWRHAQRFGNLAEGDGVKYGLGSLVRVCTGHRVSQVRVAIDPLNEVKHLGRLEMMPSEDTQAIALAESVLPPPPEFAAAGLEYVEPGHYVAHGTQDYQVWTQLGVCSCPAFTFGASRPCKHLKAAVDAENRQAS